MLFFVTICFNFEVLNGTGKFLDYKEEKKFLFFAETIFHFWQF